MMMKREYRGQRSVSALADFVKQQKNDPVQEILDLNEMETLDVSLHTATEELYLNSKVFSGKLILFMLRINDPNFSLQK